MRPQKRFPVPEILAAKLTNAGQHTPFAVGGAQQLLRKIRACMLMGHMAGRFI